MNPSLDTFRRALVAFGDDDMARAEELARAAAAFDAASLVYGQAATYLARVRRAGKANVYLTGAGFAAFIRGGGNLPLYVATSAALRAAYAGSHGLRLLEIGVGDGLALLPALDGAAIAQIDLVEPAEAALVQTATALAARGIAHRAHATTLQAFVATSDGHWDIGQATFSLQAIAPAPRQELLGWLRERVGTLLIAEFDVAELGAMYDEQRVAAIVARYERGLAEYSAETRDLVAQGFLMPVLFGYFDRTAARTNYEQPLNAWRAQLHTAGFAQVEAQLLFPYWWADAYLITAR